MIPVPTKSLNPDDYAQLTPYTGQVDAVGLGEQHPHRRWEYAMALHALAEWRQMLAVVERPALLRTLDVGGAGSPFVTLVDHPAVSCSQIDPRINTTVEAADLPPGSIDAVFAISTIEHVPDPLGFLAAIAAVLRPGGLLFLTTDVWDGVGPDTAHFHWMRERIYTMATWQALAQTCRASYQLGYFGGVAATDFTYHGAQLFGSYSFASLALVKGVV